MSILILILAITEPGIDQSNPACVDTEWVYNGQGGYSAGLIIADTAIYRDPVAAAYARGYEQGYLAGYNTAVVAANEKLAEAKARHIADLRAIQAGLERVEAALNPTKRPKPRAPRWPYLDWMGRP